MNQRTENPNAPGHGEAQLADRREDLGQPNIRGGKGPLARSAQVERLGPQISLISAAELPARTEPKETLSGVES